MPWCCDGRADIKLLVQWPVDAPRSASLLRGLTSRLVDVEPVIGDGGEAILITDRQQFRRLVSCRRQRAIRRP